MVRGNRPSPTGFKAGRHVRLSGVTYNVGDVIPNGVVAALKRVSSLLSGGWIVPTYAAGTQRHSYKEKNRDPVSLSVSERRTLSA